MQGQRPTVRSLHGMVAAAHPLAAAAGAQMLASGGNAFDAAAAVGATLGVVEPAMSGLAGMGVATCWVAKERCVKVLDFMGRVPAEFPAGRFTDISQLNRGAASCGIPSNLAGWAELIDAYGEKTLGDALEPAVALAQDGIPLTDYTLDAIGRTSHEAAGQRMFDEWRRTYTQAAGQILRQPDLARTLAAIAADGPAHLYDGPLGRALVEFVSQAGGCITARDLGAVRPAWVAPLDAAYRAWSVHVPPPPSEAFQYLLTLRLLDGFNIAHHPRGSVEHLDLVWRAIRIAAGARVRCDRSAGSVTSLFSDESIKGLRARLSDGTLVEGVTEHYPDSASPGPAQDHTTSFSVADRAGNVICCTQTLGVSFGSGMVVPGTGVCLNDLHYFGDINPDSPNALRPGGPLGLPIAPSIVTRAGQPILALGTPGGYGICQTQAQVLVQHLDYGLSLQDAIDAPRARLWNGTAVLAESRLDANAAAALQSRGHDIEQRDAWSIRVGGMHGIAIEPATGVMTGAADPRRDGVPVAPVIPLRVAEAAAPPIDPDAAQQQ